MQLTHGSQPRPACAGGQCHCMTCSVGCNCISLAQCPYVREPFCLAIASTLHRVSRYTFDLVQYKYRFLVPLTNFNPLFNVGSQNQGIVQHIVVIRYTCKLCIGCCCIGNWLLEVG